MRVTLPIFNVDSFDLTALTGGDSGVGGVGVSWVVDWSDSTSLRDSTSFGSSTYFLRVHAGSYTITAEAIPKRGAKIGAPATVQLTVCPHPQGNDLRTKDDHGTDTVQGCS
jgi:hypothetical protein